MRTGVERGASLGCCQPCVLHKLRKHAPTCSTLRPFSSPADKTKPRCHVLPKWQNSTETQSEPHQAQAYGQDAGTTEPKSIEEKHPQADRAATQAVRHTRTEGYLEMHATPKPAYVSSNKFPNSFWSPCTARGLPGAPARDCRESEDGEQLLLDSPSAICAAQCALCAPALSCASRSPGVLEDRLAQQVLPQFRHCLRTARTRPYAPQMSLCHGFLHV